MSTAKISGPALANLTPCPKCKTTEHIVARSSQSGEDTVDVWMECSKCGYDPTMGNSWERVETVWGIEKWSVLAALEVWNGLLDGKEYKERP